MSRQYKNLVCDVLSGRSSQWPFADDFYKGESVTEYSDRNGVLPILGQYLEALESGGWPQSVLKAVSIAGAANSALIEHRNRHVKTLSDRFSRSEIDFLVLKGASNAHLLYELPQYRSYADIDIFIREEQFRKVKQEFINLRFTLDQIEPARSGPFQSAATLIQESLPPVTFDIHWKINNRQVLADIFRFEELSNNAINLEIYGKGARGLGYSDALLIACIHEAGALPHEKGRLIGLYDMYLLMDKLGDEGLHACAKRAIDKRIGKIFITCVKQAGEAFGDKSHQEMLDELISEFRFDGNELSARWMEGHHGWLTEQLLDLKSVDGIPPKLEFLFSKLMRKLGRK